MESIRTTIAQEQSLPEDPARLELDQVKVSYNGHLALDDLTFQVPHGARLAVVGPNAAGKTTLLRHWWGCCS
jgi:ABC-type molybdenum transport system ATPase subunit/photorepair protein PhrA